jgi:hypothetical protein
MEATVRTAVRDLRRVGRNLDLIDQDVLAEAVAEEERTMSADSADLVRKTVLPKEPPKSNPPGGSRTYQRRR